MSWADQVLVEKNEEIRLLNKDNCRLFEELKANIDLIKELEEKLKNCIRKKEALDLIHKIEVLMAYRYTADEVALWLGFYHGRYRKIPMNLWIQHYREVGIEQMEKEDKEQKDD